MKFVTPKVFLLASTHIETGLQDYLKHVGVPDWHTDSKSDAEELIEVAGRTCYKSFAPKLNPNVTKVREGNKNYIGNLLAQAHGSCLEHASLTFAFCSVSRIVTHELIRHRIGCAYSQESLRYVRLEELSCYFPQAFDSTTLNELYHDEELAVRNSTFMKKKFQTVYENLERLQKALAEMFQLDTAKSFDIKKKITSAMRRLAPCGLATNIIATYNHRALRHVIQQRTSRHAEEEIRVLFGLVFNIVKEKYPAIYQDAVVEYVDELPEVTFTNEKV